MNITFLGATKTVTGSNFLVEGAGKRFLVDCGMYQGKASEELENEDPFLYNVDDIDFILLTHAHIDHSGRIPKIYKEGYQNPVYATKATCELCGIMLPDSGHIQEQEIEWKNKKRLRKGLKPIDAMYTAQDGLDCIEIFKAVSYDEIVEITPDIHVRYNDAGHMLGSSIIEIWIKEDGKEEKIVFTGDLGNYDNNGLLAPPTMIESADYLVMESTYGSRLHDKNDEKGKMFLDIAAQTLENNGRVIIPTFAVGRTQEIIYELNKVKDNTTDEIVKQEYEKVINSKVYVDSPLATTATEVFKQNTDLFDDDIKELIQSGDQPLEFHGLTFTQSVEESKELNMSNDSCIIMSASGMCDAGRIKHHLKHNIWNPNNTILFVGYQAQGTLGRRIVDGNSTVKIFGEDMNVGARIEYIEGFSGHADQQGLLNFVYSFTSKKPKHIFLVHGEEEGQKVLRAKIEDQLNIHTVIPDFGEKYELKNEDVTIVDQIEIKQAIKENKEEKEYSVSITDKIQSIESELDEMASIINSKKTGRKGKKNTISDSEILKLKEKIESLQEKIEKMNKE